MARKHTSACRCRGAARFPSRRRWVRWFRATARYWCRTTGAYCQRIVRILGYLGREVVVLDLREDEVADPVRIEAALVADPAITHVAQVHCETGTGILNPLPEIAAAVARQGRGLIVDAMSSFGVIPIDARSMPFDAVIAASGKCLEGVPGMGFVIARRAVLESAAGNAHSLAMDLHDQWSYMQKTGQWRFTPPTHVVAALRQALDQYCDEGGQPARLQRYRENCTALAWKVCANWACEPSLTVLCKPRSS